MNEENIEDNVEKDDVVDKDIETEQSENINESTDNIPIIQEKPVTSRAFKENKFDPECCPSAYSGSRGCVCATPEQMNYLNTRAGNRSLGGDF
jgi:hypothetical protein